MTDKTNILDRFQPKVAVMETPEAWHVTGEGLDWMVRTRSSRVSQNGPGFGLGEIVHTAILMRKGVICPFELAEFHVSGVTVEQR